MIGDGLDFLIGSGVPRSSELAEKIKGKRENSLSLGYDFELRLLYKLYVESMHYKNEDIYFVSCRLVDFF